MARLARAAVPGIPYHITHRGNHKMAIFRCDADRRRYRAELVEASRRFGLEIWAYCWMSNHIHLVAVPAEATSMARAMGLAHGRYSREFNVRRGWTGHLWANRYYSCPLDGPHLWKAVRYVELNPVRARLVDRAVDYAWSSARAHAGMAEEPDDLLSPSRPFPGGVEDWSAWLAEGLREDELTDLRLHTRTGRPLGLSSFVERLESFLGRPLRPGKPGRPSKRGQNK